MMRRLLGVIVLTAAMWLPGQSQTPLSLVFEPFEVTPEFQEGLDLMQRNRFEEAMAVFDRLGRNNQGTTLGAASLFKAASIRVTYDMNRDEAFAIYRTIISHYAGSEFELSARLALLRREHDGGNRESYLRALDSFVTSYGGPTLYDLERGSLSEASNRLHRLPSHVRSGLLDAYNTMHLLLSGEDARFSAALPLSLFMRQAYAAEPGMEADFSGEVWFDVVNLRYGLDAWPSTVAAVPVENPSVRIKSPREGQRKGPRPRIRVELGGGDWRQPQIDLSKLEWKLDNQDLRPVMKVRTRIDKSLKDGREFETLRLSARPDQELTAGSHTVTLFVAKSGYTGTGPGASNLSWVFFVGRESDDRDDDEGEFEGD